MNTTIHNTEKNNIDDLTRNPGFRIKNNFSGLNNLVLWGNFVPGWMGNLGKELSGNKINIINGTAERTTPITWLAEFEIDAKNSSKDPGKIDYVSTVTSLNNFVPEGDISLVDYKIENNGNDLYIEIEAYDKIGFLANLMKSFAYYTLFPRKMIIETKADKIFDRFWLSSIGGVAPSEISIKSVEYLLNKFRA